MQADADVRPRERLRGAGLRERPLRRREDDALCALASSLDVGVVASGNVHYATPGRARLAGALAAIRARSSLDEMDGWLSGAGTAYLRSGTEMAALLRRYPGVRERTVSVAMECAFDFRVVALNLPDFPVPSGYTEASWLLCASDLSSPAAAAADSVVMVAGLVTHRQRPPTAHGVVFISLEDGSGIANVICPPSVWERYREAAAVAPALVVSGRVERASGAASLIAVALRPLRVAATVRSRDFR